MTPEERNAMMEKFLSDALKRQGLTDEEVKIVVQFQNSRREAQAPLMQEWRKLGQVVRNEKASDAEVQAALDSYRAARKTAETAIDEARKKLDDAIHYSSRPKVEAALLLMGILDNGVQGGPGGGMFGGFGGGPGRGQGGGQGNPPQRR